MSDFTTSTERTEQMRQTSQRAGNCPTPSKQEEEI
jgi:hypothetical protein